MKGQHILINEIRQRLSRLDLNWVGVVVGSPGSGKSTVALSIACAINPKFSIEDDLFFTIGDFLKKIADGKRHKMKAYIIDEAGYGWAARSAMTKENKIASNIFQTFRMLNAAIIMTLPTIHMLDKHGQHLCDAVIRTSIPGIDRENRMNRIMWTRRQVNPISGKPYTKYPRIVEKTGEIMKQEEIWIDILDNKHIRRYKRKKSEFTMQLIRDSFEKVLAIKEKEKPIEPNIECTCGHKWHTNSKAERVMCPSCGKRSTTTMMAEDSA